MGGSVSLDIPIAQQNTTPRDLLLLVREAGLLGGVGVPTLGALQTNVATQTLSGANPTSTDFAGQVSLVTVTGSLVAGGVVAILTFSTPLSFVPVVNVTAASADGANTAFFGVASVTRSGFSIINGTITTVAGHTYLVNYAVTG